MRILIGHNRYKIPGGEDAVVNTECALLKDFGEDIHLYERSNVEFDAFSLSEKVQYARKLGWSSQTYNDVRDAIKKFKPDVAHFHNIFYAIGPAAYSACKDEGVPVVQSLHNFRLLCSNGLLYRQGRVCEDCLEKSLWQGVLHGCYGNSRVLTGFIAAMLMHHWKKGTWQNMVDVYVTASQFGRKKLIDKGLSAEKILVKPNFVHPDPGMRDKNDGYVLYVGRLSSEKGVQTLLKAWKALEHVPLKIIGDGPLMKTLKSYAKDQNVQNVEFLGYVNQKKYEEHMRGAKFLIVPSQCYESFPRVIVEAFARGVPVISSNIGTLKELVEENVTGLLFDPTNVSELAEKAGDLFNNGTQADEMGENARRVFEAKYNAHANYEHLMNIYQKAVSMANHETCMN